MYIINYLLILCNVLIYIKKIANVINIHKKGSRADCSNYRGISLMNSTYKVYTAIIKSKLQPIAEDFLQEEQCGFRKERSCTDAIFVIKQLMEKRREFNLPLFLLFLDYEKAYDRVDRQKFWEILKDYNVPQNLINPIKSIYDNTQIVLNKRSPFKVNQGLRQGCSLSPILFDTYINKIIQEWQLLKPTLKVLNYDQRNQ